MSKNSTFMLFFLLKSTNISFRFVSYFQPKTQFCKQTPFHICVFFNIFKPYRHNQRKQ